MATLRSELVATSQQLLQSTTACQEMQALHEELMATHNHVQAEWHNLQTEHTEALSRLVQQAMELDRSNALVMELRRAQERSSCREMEQNDKVALQWMTVLATTMQDKLALEKELQLARLELESANALAAASQSCLRKKEEEEHAREACIRAQVAQEAAIEREALQNQVKELQMALEKQEEEHRLELARTGGVLHMYLDFRMCLRSYTYIYISDTIF